MRMAAFRFDGTSVATEQIEDAAKEGDLALVGGLTPTSLGIYVGPTGNGFHSDLCHTAPLPLYRACLEGHEGHVRCVHLDGEGCPPALARAQQQARAIATAVSGAARARGVTRIVWGGDFNQPLGTAALREAEAKHGRCTQS